MTDRRVWKVPGVHDVIPPEGRVTLELLDERGRLKHRTFAENSLTQHYRDALATQLRGQADSVAIGFDQWGATAIGLDNDDWTNIPATGPTLPKIYAQHRQFNRSIYLSDDASAINNNWWFPIGLYAGANLDATFAGVNSRRGQLTLALCQRRWDGVRFVVDFGLDVANGVQCNSVGLGSLTFWDAGNHCFGWNTNNMYVQTGGSGYAGGSHLPVSMCRHPGTRFDYWMISTAMAGYDGVCKHSLAASNAFNNVSQRTVGGPSRATLGIANDNQCGISIIGTDFWLMDNLRLRRSAIPTGTTYTALNTYSPVTGFTDAACLGLATDGTNLYALGSTKVFVISPATGAVTSSWTHGMPVATALYYDDVCGVLWINCTPADVTVRVDQLNTPYSDITNNASSPVARLHVPFSVAGVRRATNGLQPMGSQNGGTQSRTLVVLDNGNYRIDACTIPSTAYVGFAMSLTNGGCLGSRALIASPFTKDATKVLRLTYDITFAGV
jgi:hypothetical protein